METTNKIFQRTIGIILQKHLVDPLMRGECGLKDEELLQTARLLCHIEKDIEETCLLCNGCDPKTLKRWQEDANIGFPTYHKGSGDKHYYWLDEVEEWKMKHPEVLERVDQKRRTNKR